MCDVDYFKRYNDAYGHQAGDHCLFRVAQTIIRSVKRSADIVARYGGEEFAIILPNTKLSGAIHVAETIQKSLEQLKIDHTLSEVSPYITVSMGISTIIPSKKIPLKTLVNLADTALYQAKSQGRNRYCTEILQAINN